MNIKNMFHPNKNKVLFYYPQHFNRSAEGTNPFFSPLMKACDNHRIEYEVWEEPDVATDKPRNPNAKRADGFFWTIVVIRKIVRILMPVFSRYQKEKVVAQIFNVLTFGRYRYKKYVSISGSMEELFLALYPKADVLELQHGVDYSNKISYFNNCQLKDAYKSSRWHLLSWGDGYRSCVIRGHENDFNLKERVHVVGYPMFREVKKPLNTKGNKFTILFSFQFTNDWDIAELQRYKQMIMQTLEKLEGVDCEVLLKHHPRYNNCIDLSDMYERFPFTHETKEMLTDLQESTNLHVTLNSTTGFEFAEVGIPSFFLHNADFPQRESLFYKEYNYPLYLGMNIREVVERLQNDAMCQHDARIVMEWYKKFYSPFDEELFVNLLK